MGYYSMDMQVNFKLGWKTDIVISTKRSAWINPALA